MKKDLRKKIAYYRRDPELYYRAGIRFACKKRFKEASKYFNNAVEMDPYNADYKFNLACILAELKQNRKSTQLLKDIIKDIDPTYAECYFGIGCNYFDVGNFKKARDYFEKYIYFDPEGQFVDEAYDVLYYLQIYDDGFKMKRDKIVSRLLLEGQALLDGQLYEKACLKLEKAIEVDPEAVAPRNNLALACFMSGEVERAICLARSVLKLEADNVFANCSLALFYAGSGCMDLYWRQLKVISEIGIKDKKDFSNEIEQFMKAMINCEGIGESLRLPVVEALNQAREKTLNERNRSSKVRKLPKNIKK